jgi:hypothetical protein
LLEYSVEDPFPIYVNLHYDYLNVLRFSTLSKPLPLSILYTLLCTENVFFSGDSAEPLCVVVTFSLCVTVSLEFQVRATFE